jgi:ribonucleoside-diphosphate reductase alpha chain
MSKRGMTDKLYVVKRDGSHAAVSFDKITRRLEILQQESPPLDSSIDCTRVAKSIIQGLYPGISTVEIDNLAAETAAYMMTTHPDYGRLAARIAVSNLHKETLDSFYETIKFENAKGLVSDPLMRIVEENRHAIESEIDYARDYTYSYFGFKTLTKSYLATIDGKIVERPQHMLMRVALGVHLSDFNLDAALQTYRCMSEGLFTHATPTLFNAGTLTPQQSSCFVLTMKEDSIDGIYETLKRCALISKRSGGIGLDVTNIRAANSPIRGTNGTSDGLVPMLRVFNDTARYVNQGGGKRKGGFAIYLEPWHADIFEFLDLKKNFGKEENRARDLFYGLWIPDLFMKRVMDDGLWSLFCPLKAPELHYTWGSAFEELYCRLEKEGKANKTIKARDLWFAILESQIETGTPYMLYKDAVNCKTNQSNLGIIKSSNLCSEILEYTSANEVAVCNLASIALNRFVSDTGAFDHKMLETIVRIIVRNLNKIIDGNAYPVPEAEESNKRHRPMGIGVQGFADLLIALGLAFESKEAAELNRKIFETIYFAALSESCELAKRYGYYPSYPGSPISRGIFQPDMWEMERKIRTSVSWSAPPIDSKKYYSDDHDWAALRCDIAKHGVRNSLLLALMPTASTAQILGNNECFEPYTSNIYTRKVLAGEFTIVNSSLIADLSECGLWDEEMKRKIIDAGGSIQKIQEIPQKIRDVYKTVWEIPNKTFIDLAADRGPYICQGQSLNLFMANPQTDKLSAMHFYAWGSGLKTGLYYLRGEPAAEADKSLGISNVVCRKNDPNCGSCGS